MNLNDLTNWPSSISGLTNIKYLDLTGANFSFVPSLPSSLDTLIMNSCFTITSYPTLPPSLKYLDIGSNNLSTYPTLPSSLKYFVISNNNISSLNPLPSGLTYLDCGNNVMTALPASLPSGLTYLACDRNQITSLPSLPSGLNTLACQVNSLTTLPTLPNSLCTLTALNNPNPLSNLCYSNTPSCGSFTADIPSCFTSISSFTPSSGCIGDSIDINGSAFIGTTSVKFNGTSGGYSVKSISLIRAAIPTGATTGNIVVIAPGGSATSPTTITINPTPVVNTVTTQTICTGGTTSISLTSTPSGASFTWTAFTASASTGFSPGSGTTISQTLNSGTSGDIVTYTVIPSLAGCTGSPVNIDVQINSGLDNSLTISPAMDTVCAGGNTTVTINSTETGVTYKAFSNGTTQVGNVVTGNGSSQDIAITYAELSNGINKITINASATSCPITTLIEVDTIFKSNIGTPVITTINTSICAHDSAIFQVAPGFSKYEWHYGTTSSFAASSLVVNGGTYADTVYVPGYYFVEVYDKYNCSAVAAPLNIGYGTSLPSISQSGNNGVQVNLNCSTSASFYQWYVENSSGKLKSIEGANTANFKAYFDGQYYVAIKYNSCYLYSAINVVSGMAGGNIMKQGFFEDDNSIIIPDIVSSEIEIFPNPSNGSFGVQYLSTSNERSTITLYSSMGGPAVATRESYERGFVTVDFKEYGLSNGVYFIEVIQDGKAMRKKMMIQY